MSRLVLQNKLLYVGEDGVGTQLQRVEYHFELYGERKARHWRKKRLYSNPARFVFHQTRNEVETEKRKELAKISL